MRNDIEEMKRKSFESGQSRKIPDYPCPHCGEILSGCTACSDDPEHFIPEDGSISICCSCGTLLQFAEGGLIFGDQDLFYHLPTKYALAFEMAFGKKVTVRSKDAKRI